MKGKLKHSVSSFSSLLNEMRRVIVLVYGPQWRKYCGVGKYLHKMVKLFVFLCVSVCLSVTRLVYIRVGCFFWGLTAPDQVPWHSKKKNPNIWRCLVADNSHTKWFQETWECNKLASQSVVAANRNDERTGWRRVSDWLLQMLHY